MDDHTVTGRVLAILDVLAEAGRPIGLAALTQLTGIPKPTVRRIANDLVRRQVVDRGPDGYLFGPRMIGLARAAERQVCKPDLIRPFTDELHRRTGMIAWAARADALGLLPIVACANDRGQGRFITDEWPVRFAYETFPMTAGAQLVACGHPDAMERVLRRGLPRLTPRTVVMPGQYEARVRQAAATGLATEYEESRIGWWCGAIRLEPPYGELVVGVTGRTGGASIARVLRHLEAVRDPLSRELATA